MRILCDYCGNYLDDTDEVCPHCGAPNGRLVRSGTGVPKTIEELKAFCTSRNMPLEKMRFFIGRDYKEPKAFGIYKNEAGNFVVYKNKGDGSRIVRYEGKDEAYAVNEIYQKLRNEVTDRKETQTVVRPASPAGRRSFGGADLHPNTPARAYNSRGSSPIGPDGKYRKQIGEYRLDQEVDKDVFNWQNRSSSFAEQSKADKKARKASRLTRTPYPTGKNPYSKPKKKMPLWLKIILIILVLGMIGSLYSPSEVAAYSGYYYYENKDYYLDHNRWYSYDTSRNAWQKVDCPSGLLSGYKNYFVEKAIDAKEAPMEPAIKHTSPEFSRDNIYVAPTPSGSTHSTYQDDDDDDDYYYSSDHDTDYSYHSYDSDSHDSYSTWDDDDWDDDDWDYDYDSGWDSDDSDWDSDW